LLGLCIIEAYDAGEDEDGSDHYFLHVDEAEAEAEVEAEAEAEAETEAEVLGSIWVKHPTHGLVRRSARLAARLLR
jgi:hypothetical protein